MSYGIPKRVPSELRECLESMFNSGQSEAITIAELVCDSLGDCDDEPNLYVASIADEFIEWATALKASTVPQYLHQGCECARCGQAIESEDDGQSTPSGSMHSECAAQYEAENPQDW